MSWKAILKVRTALVDFYCKCGLLDDACCMFDEMTERDVVAGNATISGCVGCCGYDDAMVYFMKMQKEGVRANSVTVVALLLACGELLDLRRGKEIHGYCLRNGLFDFNHLVGTALMGFYMKSDVKIACLVFSLMRSKNTVSWNAMITGYFDNCHYLKAIKVFVQMLISGFNCDSVTMLVVLQACIEYGSFDLGVQFHQLVVKFGFSEDMYIINALINMYSKNGMLDSSFDLFKSLFNKDVAMWNSMISAFLDSGSVEEALSLFTEMQLACISGDV